MTYISSLRSRMLLLLLLTIIPIIGLILYTYASQRQQANMDVEQDVKDFLHLAAKDQEGFVEGTQRLLSVIAHAPAIINSEPVQCNTFLDAVQKSEPLYIALGVVDMNGDMLCSAPRAKGLNYSDRAWFKRAMESRGFTGGGDYYIGRITRKRNLTFGHAIVNQEGVLHGAIFASTDLAWMNRLVSTLKLPEQAVAVVIESGGTILARHPDTEKWVGLSQPDSVLAKIMKNNPGEGLTEIVDTDGVKRLYAYTPLVSANNRAYLFIGLSRDKAFARADHELITNLSWLAVITLLAIFMARFGAYWLVLKPINTLVGVAQKLGAGQLQSRSNLETGVTELSQLSSAMDHMADALEVRERERTQNEQALRDSENRFRSLTDLSSDWYWEQDENHKFTFISGGASEKAALNQVECLGKTRWEIAAMEMDWSSHLGILASRQAFYDLVYERVDINGNVRYLSISGRPYYEEDGRFVGYHGVGKDITEQHQSRVALHQEKERAQVTLQSIADAVITTNLEGLIEYLNPVAETLTGWKNDEASGKSLTEVFNVIDEATRTPVASPVTLLLQSGETPSPLAMNHILLLQRSGPEILIEDSAAPIYDYDRNIIGMVLVFRDISDARRMAEQLSHQASHDALTGLINRLEFERRLALALVSSRAQNKKHSFLYLDLDQFKIVNDTCGHTAGDQLLRQISVLLHSGLREGDTLARLGGDEFGILLENCPAAPAERIAEKLRQAISDFHFVWQNKSFTLGASIGLVSFDDDSLTLSDILSAADTACYFAKDKGRNRIHVYYPGDSEFAVRHGEMEWVARIHKALAENRFCLYSQKIAPIHTGHHGGVHHELLIRMFDEQGKLVPPMAFIPAAERYNIMPTIDRWVIQTAFAHYSKTPPDESGAIQTWAINLSGASLSDEEFLDFVREQFTLFSVPHRVICFEITETAAIANLAKVAHFIRELKALGCRFSLDDFGSGMSSFGYLKELPVDFLKIDGGFVKDMVTDPIDRAMVEAINSIGHVMGIQTIAEFVEDDKILALLKKIGVDFAQGYGIAKPEPFIEFKPESGYAPSSPSKSPGLRLLKS